jgi:hypothetical protein
VLVRVKAAMEREYFYYKDHDKWKEMLVAEKKKSYKEGLHDLSQAHQTLQEELKAARKEMIREIIRTFELDALAHAQGKCSFPLMALCCAEEQRIKLWLASLASKEGRKH